MEVRNTMTESAYDVLVDYDGDNSFKVEINGHAIYVDKDEWLEMSQFIRDSMDFIIERTDY